MLFKSGMVTQASGSLGGITASHNRGGMYFRSRAIPTDPGSPAQLSARNALSSLSEAWFNDLTQAERDAWDTYALNVPLPNAQGDPINVGGLGMYVRSNVPLIMATEARIDAAPTVFTEGRPVVGASFTATESTQQLVITISGSLAAVSRVQIQMGVPQNGSIRFFKGPFRRQSTNPPGDFPLTTTPIFPIAEGQRVWLRLRTLMDDGRVGPATIVAALVVA